MRLKLRAGEKLYLNGAVIKVERKATIELLNDAAFLLEAHVIQPSEANTPLRQLYFVLQTQLMERDGAPLARQMFHQFALPVAGRQTARYPGGNPQQPAHVAGTGPGGGQIETGQLFARHLGVSGTGILPV